MKFPHIHMTKEKKHSLGQYLYLICRCGARKTIRLQGRGYTAFDRRNYPPPEKGWAFKSNTVLGQTWVKTDPNV